MPDARTQDVACLEATEAATTWTAEGDDISEDSAYGASAPMGVEFHGLLTLLWGGGGVAMSAFRQVGNIKDRRLEEGDGGHENIQVKLMETRPGTAGPTGP